MMEMIYILIVGVFNRCIILSKLFLFLLASSMVMSLLVHPMMEDAGGQEDGEADGSKKGLSSLFPVWVAPSPSYVP